MSATAKTLGSLVIALIGLVVYLGLFLGIAVFKIGALSYALYLGLALTLVLFTVVIMATTVGAKEM
ncbi:MAG TPA: hypothetical protein HPQ04_15155 [Rhodospirillaceae bacterium]|nr:hypothetical protein [Rhodospirillaceae bacterium]